MKTSKLKKIFTFLLISSFINQTLHAANPGQLPTIREHASEDYDGLDCQGIDRPICDSYYSNWDGPTIGGGGPSNPIQLPTITVDATLEDSEDNDCKTTSNPILIASGTKLQEETDFESQGYEMPLTFGRVYNSNRADGTKPKWAHSFDYRLVNDKNGNVDHL